MKTIAELQQVTKCYGAKTAVSAIDLTIHSGSVVAILGPNGAGKTTTLSMMLGLIEPTNGTVKLFGMKPREVEVRKRIGAMLQKVDLIDGLKVREVIALVRSYYPDPIDMDRLMTVTGITPDEFNKQANKLSGGQQRRLSFALALAGDPDLLFLDEPTVGMDVTARRAFWIQIKELAAQGKTILFSTHYLQEAEDAADRILLFNQGSIVADDAPEIIMSKLTRRSISFRSSDPSIQDLAAALPSAQDCYSKDGRFYVITDNTDVLLAEIFLYQIPANDIRTELGRLDDAFEQLTSHEEEA